MVEYKIKESYSATVYASKECKEALNTITNIFDELASISDQHGTLYLADTGDVLDPDEISSILKFLKDGGLKVTTDD